MAPAWRPKSASSAPAPPGPLRFDPEYQDALERAANLTVYLWGNVTSVDRDRSIPHAAQVTVRTLERNGYTVRTRHFVLALGGIENARLLLLSNEIEAAGLGNGHDLVGRYFMEHIRWWGASSFPPIRVNSWISISPSTPTKALP